MIISRTPLRISFAGGGSDLPSFYAHEQGAVLSTSIDKYIYLAAHKFFDPDKVQLKYSKTELVNDFSEIQHPIFRECLSMLTVKGIDINSIADIPAGTGLGSSSSFTVGVLHVLNTYKHRYVSQEYLAATACGIEIGRLKEPIGKQDQYAAAYGGLNFISFNADESVDVEKIIMKPEVKQQLEKNLIMIYTGDTRSASGILQHQNQAMGRVDKRKIQKEMVKQAFELKEILQNNRIDDFGRMLHEGWMLKKTLTAGISNLAVDDLYQKGLDAGALGGKLLGAGGGGFILFYCPEEKQEVFRQKMAGYRELPFCFDNSGSKIIYVEND
ncbi:MAG: GHMP kinase [Prevotellaceae bacterium]|jgi:D-glycero-alpha-D-manno-heptose-7-phosphate kinase|nr:GHMP kinase [Prevotellaceae bacterium]